MYLQNALHLLKAMCWGSEYAPSYDDLLSELRELCQLCELHELISVALIDVFVNLSDTEKIWLRKVRGQI